MSLSKRASQHVTGLKEAVSALRLDTAKDATKSQEKKEKVESHITSMHRCVLRVVTGTEEYGPDDAKLALPTMLDPETDLLRWLITNHQRIGLEARKQIVDITEHIVEDGTQYDRFLAMVRKSFDEHGQNEVLYDTPCCPNNVVSTMLSEHEINRKTCTLKST